MRHISEALSVAEALEKIKADLGDEYDLVEVLADALCNFFEDDDKMQPDSALLLGAYILREVRNWEDERRRYGRPH